MRLVVVFVLILVLQVQAAHAIVIRHDRDPSSYTELAREFDFVCTVGGAMGALVGPEWVLTAGHVAEPLGRGDIVRFAAREVEILETFVHPEFGFAESHRDLALLRLSETVTEIEPAMLYRQRDEVGQRVTLVGAGQTGTGIEGPSEGPAVMRAAHNLVDATRPGWLSFAFDAPPKALDLEGISGPGDSGGPALLRNERGWAIVGVSAYNDGDPHCTYGTVEHYCRVSDNLDWIRGIMSGEIKPSGEPSVLVHGTDERGRATVSRERVVPVEIDASENESFVDLTMNLAAALNAGDLEMFLGAFDPGYLERKRAQGDPVEGMFEFFASAKAARGRIVGFHALPQKGIQIPESSSPMRPVTFHLADGTPGYLGIAADEEGLIDHLSLFIQSSICDGGASCEKVVIELSP